MLGIGGDVASLISLHRVNFVHFIFSETDGAQVTNAKPEADNDQDCEHADHSPSR